MARTSDEDDALVKFADLDAEPSFIGAAHVRGDDPQRFFIGVIERPFNADRPGGCAWLNKSSTSKAV
jgi:hypothetical protein